MKLRAPYSGGIVEADEAQAARLIERGYKPVEEKPKRAPRKRTKE